MRQEFIKGTDKQYSIRENGIIIRHWKISRYKTKCYKNVIVNGSFDRDGFKIFVYTFRTTRKRKIYYVNTLLKNYFNLDLPPKGYKANTLSKKEKEKRRKTRCQNYKINNPEKVKITSRKNGVTRVKKVTKSYVSTMLRLKVNEISNELYLITKRNILLKRKISNQIGIDVRIIHKL